MTEIITPARLVASALYEAAPLAIARPMTTTQPEEVSRAGVIAMAILTAALGVAPTGYPSSAEALAHLRAYIQMLSPVDRMEMQDACTRIIAEIKDSVA